MKGPFGQTVVTYLGTGKGAEQTLYDFYDGETVYACVATASQTLAGRMNIMHFTEKNVNDYIKEEVS